MVASCAAVIGRPGIGGFGLKQKSIEVFCADEVSFTSLDQEIYKGSIQEEGHAYQAVDICGDAVDFFYDIKSAPSFLSDKISKTAI